MVLAAWLYSLYLATWFGLHFPSNGYSGKGQTFHTLYFAIKINPADPFHFFLKWLVWKTEQPQVPCLRLLLHLPLTLDCSPGLKWDR
jgi:hypothetical protein